MTGAWWAGAVVYQVYVRSFADSDGNGVGDLAGIRDRVPYLADLGVDAVWLTPFYRSPMIDHGYDVSDPRDVDPIFGTLADFDALVSAMHDAGLKLIVDIVPNHSSSAHPWFVEALAAAPGSPARERYFFREGTAGGPPNNWSSILGGPAWTQTPDGQWYLHLFAAEQPDLNYDNADVLQDLVATLRFWLDRGVDGFRVDVAHGIGKLPGLPDMPVPIGPRPGLLPESVPDPRFDAPRAHDVHRMIRRVVDDYTDRMAVGEIWVPGDEAFARYLRPDELHQGFNFHLAQADFTATAFREAVDRTLRSRGDTAPTWTLSNHDISRPVSRYGSAARARAAALFELALPGSTYLFNGEELGLPDVALPDWAIQDPIWERSGHTERGRDPARVPLPWSGYAPPYGFSSTSSTWLPMPDDWAPLTVAAQLADPSSTLNFFRTALRIRRDHLGGLDFRWLDSPADTVTFARDRVVCALNLGAEPVPLPEGEVLLASGPVDGDVLPPDTAAWLGQTSSGSRAWRRRRTEP